MKYTISILALSVGLFLTGCGSDDEGHSHGEGADHTHEQPAQQSTDDSDAVRIGGGEDSNEEESDHSHDEDSDHSHEEEHSHEDDSTHTHGDEEHSH